MVYLLFTGANQALLDESLYDDEDQEEEDEETEEQERLHRVPYADIDYIRSLYIC